MNFFYFNDTLAFIKNAFFKIFMMFVSKEMSFKKKFFKKKFESFAL